MQVKRLSDVVTVRSKQRAARHAFLVPSPMFPEWPRRLKHTARGTRAALGTRRTGRRAGVWSRRVEGGWGGGDRWASTPPPTHAADVGLCLVSPDRAEGCRNGNP